MRTVLSGGSGVPGAVSLVRPRCRPDPFEYPLRLRTSTNLGFKNPKWITSTEVTNTLVPGYWERLGFNWQSSL